MEVISRLLSQPVPVDDRLGFATHFDQGPAPYSPVYVMPLIAPTGAAWIRDDCGWSVLEHTAKGSYSFYSGKLAWMEAAHANGLKLVADVQAGGPYSPPSAWYANPYDPAGYSAACAWLATQTNPDGTPLVSAIEVLNEPNNNFRTYENSIGRGNLWREDYVALLNATYAAVKAANPAMPVIGCGMQGADILYCISIGAKCDGIVAHPYDPNNEIPESVYEPPYTDYAAFVAALRAATPVPLWFTEQAVSTGQRTYEYNEAVWVARRLLLAFGLGVERTFLYDFVDSSMQGIIGYYYDPKQSYFVVKKRLMPLLSGLVSKGSLVSTSNQDSNWLAADFRNFVFTVPGGRTVAALWFGNHKSQAGSEPKTSVVSVRFPLQRNHWYAQSGILDLVTGQLFTVYEPSDTPPAGSAQWGYDGAIHNVSVSGNPTLIIVP